MTSSASLDTLRLIATPEGCEISLRTAGPVARARAWMLDFFIRLAVWIVLITVLGYLNKLGAGLMMVSAFALEWFYPVLFEVLWRGRTPGKRAFGLAVVHDDGTPVGWGASFVRNTLRWIDFMPMAYAAGFTCMLLNREGKRLGDLAAGTLVVHTDAPDKNGRETPPEDAEAPPFPLTPDEQRALIEYGRRAGRLTTARAEELALAVEPLTAGLSGDSARKKLLRIAGYLLGARGS